MQDVTRDGRLLVFDDCAIRAVVDLKVYRLLALQKAAYRLADRCTVVIGEADGETVTVELMFASHISESAAMEVARQFFQELLDQELREKIGEQTGAVRALILAQAFSKTDLIRRE